MVGQTKELGGYSPQNRGAVGAISQIVTRLVVPVVLGVPFALLLLAEPHFSKANNSNSAGGFVGGPRAYLFQGQLYLIVPVAS